MEVDSEHATIERKLKHVDYLQLIRAAMINPNPYDVQYLRFAYHLNFEIYKGLVKTLKPGKWANVNNKCALKNSPGGSIYYKLQFADGWKNLGRKTRFEFVRQEPSQL